jgi:phospholipid/cholesterol/gamma-HCH transport system substrate-binding protein
MKQIDRESISALIKLGIFFAFTGISTLILALTLGNGSFGDRKEYKAVFSDVTGMAKGDDVRIAGVAVGSVKKVQIIKRDKALVTFGVDSDVPLTDNTHATIKFRNLVGQRYIALTQGADGAKSTLKAGSTIPQSRTQEALDLNVLLNGFKPVFQALSPTDTNKFAYEIVQTLQGESGNVENLLARTSSLTNTLAGRDQLIGDVVTNLSEVLDTVGSRCDPQLGRLDLRPDRRDVRSVGAGPAGAERGHQAAQLIDQEPQLQQEPVDDRDLDQDLAIQAAEDRQRRLDRR